jgi:hypothetical protein
MKRKNDDQNGNGPSKKRALSEDDVQQSFRTGLFGELNEYADEYAESKP